MIKFKIENSLPSKSDNLVIVVSDLKEVQSFFNSHGIDYHAELLEKYLKDQGDSVSAIDKQLGLIHFIKVDIEKINFELVKLFRRIFQKIKNQLGKSVSILVQEKEDVNFTPVYSAIINSLLLTKNQLGKFKVKPNGISQVLKVKLVPNSSKKELEDLIKTEETLAATQLSLIDLVNTPSNIKTPEYIADLASSLAKQHGFKIKVFGKKEILKEKLSALISVNQGSQFEPRFLILEYDGGNKNAKTLGLVGKGVTFDSGGISIKPSTNMHMMKSDMAGAALVLFFTSLAAKLKLPVRIVTAIPLTENMVSGNGTKPGDVIGSYIGKSIEVIDTDAEGRLILADALGFLTKNFKTDALIDFATLTGSVIQALGFQVAGLFSNDNTLADMLFQSGLAVDEKCWEMPIFEHYTEDLKSDIADLKNYSGRSVAGSISAALFLKEFIGDHKSWAHMDIAGVAFTDNEFGSMRSASGYGLRLLFQFVNQFSKS